MASRHAREVERVLHLLCTSFFGGPERQIVNHAVAARRMGLSVTIGIIHDCEGSRDVLAAAKRQGLETAYIEASHSYSPAIIRQIARLLRRGDYDVSVSHGYKANILLWLLSRGGGRARIAYSRGWTRENLKVRAFHAMDRFVLRRSPFVVSVSEGNRRALIDAGVPAEAITVVHNAVDLDEMARAAATDGVDPRREFEVPDGSRVLIASGRFSPEKGFADLVSAAAHLRSSRQDWVLILFGEGQEEEALRERVRRADLEPFVRFAGFRADYLAHLARGDLLVLPSHSEGLPNVVLEAFALGVPVVSTAVGGVPELVEHDRTGLLVPASDPEQLARAVDRLMSDGAGASRLAARARELVRERFGFEKQAEKLLALYDRAAGLRSR